MVLCRSREKKGMNKLRAISLLIPVFRLFSHFITQDLVDREQG